MTFDREKLGYFSVKQDHVFSMHLRLVFNSAFVLNKVEIIKIVVEYTS